MQFELDFFNLFNKVQFNSTGMNLSLSNYGTVCGVGASTNANTPLVRWTPGQLDLLDADGCDVHCGIRTTTTFAPGVQNNFGQVANDRGPRQIQYGLKIDF